MSDEIERPLLEHLESQEFEETLNRAAVKSRTGKRIRLGDEAVFGEVIDCSILDLSLTDLSVLDEDGSALVQGNFVEAIQAEGAEEKEAETRRGNLSGYVRVKALFPKQEGTDLSGYLSDLELDLGELEWTHE
jgi:hypothetical protein